MGINLIFSFWLSGNDTYSNIILKLWIIKLMVKTYSYRSITLFSASLFIIACQPKDFSQLSKVPASLIATAKKSASTRNSSSDRKIVSSVPLGEILNGTTATQNQGSDFISTVKYAIETDPNIISMKRDIEAKLASVLRQRAQKEFQVGTTVYGGYEDFTENEKGLALAFNASRLVFDGGKLDLQIESAQLDVVSAKMNLSASINKRAYELCRIWLDLDKYRTLQRQIDKRLAVLDPLIVQLEQVAKAGIGDVSKVTAAQRTVSAIRVEQTNIGDRLAQAQLEFSNAFGFVAKDVNFDYDFISELVPVKISDELVQNSPLLQSQYASYQSATATAASLRAKDGFDVGFEARVMKPFAGSGKESDESLGLVGRKTLFNGNMLESEIEEAEAIVKVRAAQIQATYRKGLSSIETAFQNIVSMNKAILIAKENAKLTKDEIIYLKQQLVIGGSTLDSVLSAEATLYEAESKEIKFLTEKRKSELLIVSTLGLLSRSLGF